MDAKPETADSQPVAAIDITEAQTPAEKTPESPATPATPGNPATPVTPATPDAPAISDVSPTADAAEPSDASAAPIETPSPDQNDQPASAETSDTPETPATTSDDSKNSTSKSDDEDTEKEFDPAVDLPMYRDGMNWFVLRVASNKEKFVRETLMRKVQIEGLNHLVGRIMVPTEKTKTLKGGKARITETKLYPGYTFVEMKLENDGRIPQDVFFLIKETTGVGDFVGTAGRPTPMKPHEVEKMLFDSRKPEEAPTLKMEFAPGDNVVISEGPFENYQGTVDEVMPDKGKVRVLVTIFGRQAPVELEYWQIRRDDE